MPFRADPERAARRSPAQIPLLHVVLQRAEKDVRNTLRDGNEPQRAVFRSLARQRRPALVGPEHAADRRRRNLARLQPVPRVERVVAAPVAGEDVLVDLLIARIDPALHRARVHVRGKAERLVPRLPAPEPVGIGALQVGIEDACVFPQPIEKRARLGQPGVLPRHDLRPGPVDVEDLRLPCLQRGEVLVEAPFLDFPLFIAVGLEVFADLREPAAGQRRREHAANHHAAAAANRSSNVLRDLAVSYVLILELRHDRPAGSGLRDDAVSRSTDMVLDVRIGTPQRVTIRRQPALERHNLVTYVHGSTSDWFAL